MFITFTFITAIILLYLNQISDAYISSYSSYNNNYNSGGYNNGGGYSAQQGYFLNQPYSHNGYSGSYSNSGSYQQPSSSTYATNYNPYSNYYFNGYLLARPNAGMLPGGYVEPGNIGWGNNLASVFLFCQNCPSRG